MELKVARCPSNELANTGCLFVSPQTIKMLGEVEEVHLEIGGIVYTTRASEKVEPGAIALSGVQRKDLRVSEGDKVLVAVFPARETDPLTSATIEVDFATKAKPMKLDAKEISSTILSRYTKRYVTTGQTMTIDFQGTTLSLKVQHAVPAALAARHARRRRAAASTRAADWRPRGDERAQDRRGRRQLQSWHAGAADAAGAGQGGGLAAGVDWP